MWEWNGTKDCLVPPGIRFLEYGPVETDPDAHSTRAVSYLPCACGARYVLSIEHPRFLKIVAEPMQ